MTTTVLVYHSPRDDARWVGVDTGDRDDVGTDDERARLTDVVQFDTFGQRIGRHEGAEVTTANLDPDDEVALVDYLAAITADLDHATDVARQANDRVRHLTSIVEAVESQLNTLDPEGVGQ